MIAFRDIRHKLPNTVTALPHIRCLVPDTQLEIFHGVVTTDFHVPEPAIIYWFWHSRVEISAHSHCYLHKAVLTKNGNDCVWFPWSSSPCKSAFPRHLWTLVLREKPSCPDSTGGTFLRNSGSHITVRHSMTCKTTMQVCTVVRCINNLCLCGN